MFPKDGSGGEGDGHVHSQPADGGGGLTEGVVRTETSGQTGSMGRTRGLFNPPPSPPLDQESMCPPSRVNITVAPFTGGPFEVRVSRTDTIDDLKKVIARRLKVSKERIYLLYRESELIEGSVSTNLLVDGSTVTLLPRAETGLISPKPEQSVMQALESLNDQQVNDFLSGAAPLNLTMRLGDHMMLIQLQLSTVNQISSSRRKHSTIQISSSSPPYPTPPPSAPSSPTSNSSTESPSPSNQPPRKVRVPLLSPGGLYGASSTPSSSSMPSSSSAPSLIPSSTSSGVPPQPSALSQPSYSNRDVATGEPSAKRPKLDPKALAEASKNLTQTLKQLSSEVLTTKPEATTPKPKKEERQRKRRATDGKGAIIESMHHHGKGVYSGTFSGTLNPALQDASGQPKRDITTIIHILNDLLCAQFKAYSGSHSSKHNSTKHGHHRESSKIYPNTDNKTSFDCEPDMKLLEDELLKTKMEAIKKTMQENKAKRQARRQAARASGTSAYSTAWSVKSSETTNTSSLSTPAGPGCDSSPDQAAPKDTAEHFIKPEPEPVTA